MKKILNAKDILKKWSKRLNMHIWETWDLWAAMKSPSKGVISKSWTWNTSNRCYGVRYRASNHEEGSLKQI